jgi:hypothetical protein
MLKVQTKSAQQKMVDKRVRLDAME